MLYILQNRKKFEFFIFVPRSDSNEFPQMNLQRSKLNNVHFKGQSKLFFHGRFWKPFHATFSLFLPESLKGLYDEKQAAKVSWVDR